MFQAHNLPTFKGNPFLMRKLVSPFLLSLLFIVVSCNPAYRAQSITYENYRITQEQKNDPSLSQLMKPYSDSVNSTMNEVVGIVEKDLDKKSPESALGNFVADAIHIMAKEKYASHVDASFVNSGGIRLNQLPAGPVTKGKIFELMPFDNLLILQKVNGSVLQQFLDLTAARGGWPVAGLTMQIKDKKAINVVVGGKPIDPSATYTIANSDYIANGGDNADMLRNIMQESIGYLVRDAIFDYVSKFRSQGRNISAKEENRVTNAQ